MDLHVKLNALYACESGLEVLDYRLDKDIEKDNTRHVVLGPRVCLASEANHKDGKTQVRWWGCLSPACVFTGRYGLAGRYGLTIWNFHYGNQENIWRLGYGEVHWIDLDL